MPQSYTITKDSQGATSLWRVWLENEKGLHILCNLEQFADSAMYVRRRILAQGKDPMEFRWHRLNSEGTVFKVEEAA